MFDELIIHTGAVEATRATSSKGGSPWYVPRSVDGLNSPNLHSVKVVINSMVDPMKFNTPLGVVDVFLL